jgi:hypothetical protein
MSIELKTSEVTSNKEILTHYLNMFNERVITGVIDLEHYLNIKADDPSYKAFKDGQQVTVDQLIEGQRKSILYARRNAKYIAGLIELDGEGKLAEKWSDDVVLTPLEKYEAEKPVEEKK